MTPNRLQGHWHRTWIKAPDFEDAETRVHWMQCGTRYADIRVPVRQRDLRGAGSLSDLSPATLLRLMQAEGFAGEIEVKDGVCTWHRAINWHGTSDSVDAGRLSFEAPDILFEDGVHASYTEKWERVSKAAESGLRLRCAPWHAVLVTVGAYFVFGLGHPAAPPSSRARAALDAGEITADVEAHFNAVYAFGIWDGGRGQAILSTNPLLEGREILRCVRSGLVYEDVDFRGVPRGLTLLPDSDAAEDAA